MSSPSVSTTLSSIVRIRGNRTAEILEDSDPLALLHSKFWGTSMEVEERNWRNTVTDTQAPAAGVGDGMDVDEKIQDPGCYMVNIGIDSFRFQKFWVRLEYIRIFDYVQAYFDKERVHNIAPAVVITGQPGIGESFVASWFTFMLLT